MNPLYRIQDLEKYYSGRQVLKIPRMEIRKEEILGVVGPNGSGKSTLLRILAFLEKPSQGSIFFEDERVAGMEHLRKKVSLLLQNSFLLKRTVFDNVAYGLKIRNVPLSHVPGRVEEVLDWVGLDPGDFSGRQWYELSGGEVQRVALASRLAIRPLVLMLDEPTASVDLKSEVLIKRALLRAQKEWGTTLVMVSHDYPWLQSVCDRTVSMSLGEVIMEGHVNTFHGPWLKSGEEGLYYMLLHDGQRIFACCRSVAPGVGVLSPEEIVLAAEPPGAISARNCIEGMVERMFFDRTSGGVMVNVNIGCMTLTSRITRGSIQKMGIEPGKKVWAFFKASSFTWTQNGEGC